VGGAYVGGLPHNLFALLYRRETTHDLALSSAWHSASTSSGDGYALSAARHQMMMMMMCMMMITTTKMNTAIKNIKYFAVIVRS